VIATNVVAGAAVVAGAEVAGVVSPVAEPLLGNVEPGNVVVGKIAEFFWNKVVDTPDGSPLVEPEPPHDAKTITASARLPIRKTLELIVLLHTSR
jgi:hypothetical protein